MLIRFWILALVIPLVVVGCNRSGPEQTAELDTAAGDASALIRLGEKQQAELQIDTLTVRPGSVTHVLEVPGTVTPSPDAYAVVSAPIGGRVVRIMAHEGAFMHQGQILAELESLAFASLVGSYLEARAEADFQAQQVARYQPLVEERVVAQRTLEEARSHLRRAEALVLAARARLSAVGVDDGQLDGYIGGAVPANVLVVAPRTGYIQEHHIDLGQAVEAYEGLATLINPTEVVVHGFVAPADVQRVQPGAAVTVRVTNQAHGGITATVASIQPAMDAEQRAVVVNVRVLTPERELVPGQRVMLTIQAEAREAILRVPVTSLVYEGNDAVVFVRQDASTYERRRVEIGRITTTEVEILAGLMPGEVIAISEVFSLKALGRYAQYAEE